MSSDLLVSEADDSQRDDGKRDLRQEGSPPVPGIVHIASPKTAQTIPQPPKCIENALPNSTPFRRDQIAHQHKGYRVEAAAPDPGNHSSDNHHPL